MPAADGDVVLLKYGAQFFGRTRNFAEHLNSVVAQMRNPSYCIGEVFLHCIVNREHTK